MDTTIGTNTKIQIETKYIQKETRVDIDVEI